MDKWLTRSHAECPRRPGQAQHTPPRTLSGVCVPLPLRLSSVLAPTRAVTVDADLWLWLSAAGASRPLALRSSYKCENYRVSVRRDGRHWHPRRGSAGRFDVSKYRTFRTTRGGFL